ncbi:alpha/beta-hydrolase [Jackrogersella minutella]|nr:alpha/beta-hydrolase [Jackrogersella minutella]
MTANAKPAILIVHGGWHVPESYAKLTAALEATGYEVHVPRLPSVNDARPPTADLSTDTAYLRDCATRLVEAGRTLVAVMHSYGGHVGTNALYGLGAPARSAQGLTGGISSLIYLTAYAVPAGQAMVDTVNRFGHADLIPLAFDCAADDTCVPRDPRGMLTGPGCSDAETDAYLRTLVRWNGRCMYQPSEHCAWRDGGIAVAYIYTTKDATVPVDYQRSFAEGMEREGVRVRTFELATGHCPNLTATEGVVDAINKVVSG